MVFDVKNNTSFDGIKSALAVCDDENYLKSIKYDDDGGVLICETGTKFYNIKNSTAIAEFTYEEEKEEHGIQNSDLTTMKIMVRILR